MNILVTALLISVGLFGSAHWFIIASRRRVIDELTILNAVEQLDLDQDDIDEVHASVKRGIRLMYANPPVDWAFLLLSLFVLIFMAYMVLAFVEAIQQRFSIQVVLLSIIQEVAYVLMALNVLVISWRRIKKGKALNKISDKNLQSSEEIL